MGFWNRRPKEETPPPAPPPAAAGGAAPLRLDRRVCSPHEPAFDLYRAIREAVPVVDAAIRKLVRLAGGVGVTCPDKGGGGGAEPLPAHGAGGVEPAGHPGLFGQLPGLPAHLRPGGGGDRPQPGRAGDRGGAVRAGVGHPGAGGDSPWRWCWPRSGPTGRWRTCQGRNSSSLPRTTPARRTPMGCPCCGVCRFWRGSF